MHWTATEEHEALLLVCHLFFTETDAWAEQLPEKDFSYNIWAFKPHSPHMQKATTCSTFVFSHKTTMAQPPSLHFSGAPLTREGINTVNGPIYPNSEWLSQPHKAAACWKVFNYFPAQWFFSTSIHAQNHQWTVCIVISLNQDTFSQPGCSKRLENNNGRKKSDI